MRVENELKVLRDKTEKLKAYCASFFIGQSYFFNDGALLNISTALLYFRVK